MSNKFNWGIIGAGWIAERFTADLRLNSHSNAIAIAARDLNRAHTFLKKHDCKYAFDDYQSLINHPDVDIVYVALPHNFHFEWAKRCLLAGKPVLVEKPFTLNTQQANALFELADKNNVFIMEAFWTKFFPTTVEAINLIKRGEIGDIRHINSAFCHHVAYQADHRVFNRELAGGALLDIGVYPLLLSQWLLGNPTSWQSTHKISATGVDIDSCIQATWQGGQTATLTCSVSSATPPSESVIQGSKGHIRIPNLWINATSFEIEKPNEKTQTVTPAFTGYGLRFQAQAVENCIQKNQTQSAQHSWQDTLNLLQWTDAVRKDWGLSYPDEIKIQ